jgi:hypothetical protein
MAVFTHVFEDGSLKPVHPDVYDRFSSRGCAMKARLLWLQVFLVAALVFPPTVPADQANLSLGSALDQARMQNPQVAMARARVSEAEGCASKQA